MTRLRLVLLPLAITSFLTGCSEMPNMHFGASIPDSAPPPGNYTVQAITPTLLAQLAPNEPQNTVAQANPGLARAIKDFSYKVAPRDVLSIIVWGDPSQTALFRPAGGAAPTTAAVPSATTPASAFPNASAPVTGFKVNTDGSLYFPYVGNIIVGGKTTQEIQADITHRLEPFIQNPQVTVDVTEFNSQKYQLAGAVMKPGLYPVTDTPVTVSQAISAAGGIVMQVPNTVPGGNTIPRALGDLSHVVYVHDGRASLLNIRALYIDGDENQDRLVQPGDTIQVPDNSQEQVHIIGEVPQPGNYPLNNGVLNLTQLLGDAGEPSLITANPSRVFVFRGAYQKPEIYWLDARSPDALLLANKFELKPQDVVYVASTSLTDWNRVISQILPTVQTLYETKVLVNQ